jgi:carbonic anhydrase
VRAAYERQRLGLIDNWLRHIVDVHGKHRDHISAIGDEALAIDRLCELNVIEQVANVCHTSIARDAWERRQPLAVHGWVYGINDGLLKDLDVTVTAFDEAGEIYRAALRSLS